MSSPIGVVWIGDVMHAFLKALDGPVGVYNIGTDRETRIIDL